MSVIACNILIYCILSTDTPTAGCRSSMYTSTASYAQLPTPATEKGKHVFVTVFVIQHSSLWTVICSLVSLRERWSSWRCGYSARNMLPSVVQGMSPIALIIPTSPRCGVIIALTAPMQLHFCWVAVFCCLRVVVV